MSEKPRIGVSACLLGRPVRFDGGHKRDAFISDALPEHFDLVPVCPEAELGLGVPRPALQLRRDGDRVRLVTSATREDLSERMEAFITRRLDALDGLSGFIFKKGSPSCGMERVPVAVSETGHRARDGVGLFARAFMARNPLVPTEEERRLHDPLLRTNFFERVYALDRWHRIADPDRNPAGFQAFHARHKLMLMARDPTAYRELGRLVAATRRNDLKAAREAYIVRFMATMARHPDRGGHVNALTHAMGFLKRSLPAADRQELLALFDAYRRKEVPLITPVTLLRHHLRRHGNPYLAGQHYLAPCPDRLAQRAYRQDA